MANKKFTEEEMKHLHASTYVIDVSLGVVHFSAEFKKKFWEAFLEGNKPRDIVIQLGIDPNILEEARVSGLKGMICNEVKAGKGFRDLETYNQHIDAYITPEGKSNIWNSNQPIKIRNWRFKKNCIFKGGGGRIMIVPASAKYQVIQEMMQCDNNMLSVSWLCEAANVSRSGYYHHLATEELRI